MSRWTVFTIAVLGFLQITAGNAADVTAPITPVPVAPPAAPPPVVVAAPVAAPAATATRPPSVSVVPASGTPMLIEAGKGTLVKLGRAAATVFVANPDVADVSVKSPSLIYVSAKAPGETVVYAVDADDNVLLNAPVRVVHDLSRVRQSLHSLMPGENIAVNSVENSLVLSGDVSTADRAQKAKALATAVTGDIKNAEVVNQLSVDTPNQINLHVRIAEVNRSVLKALGFNWSGTWSSNRLDQSKFAFATQNPFTNQNISTSNLFQYGFGLPGTGSLQVTLDALSSEGLITTLAEPNLTALSGQTASFLAGGEFPVPVSGTSNSTGAPTITIEFKTFGVALDFTPTIIDANHLNLKVRPEVSQLSSTGAVSVPLTSTATVTIPALTVRRAETTVELGSGQSFALAGLLQNTTEQDVAKIPWLGDIPVIGPLFRSNLFQHNETELVIIVTPYLVRPTATAMATPTDGFKLPHDAAQVLSADTYRQTLPGPMRGPVGAGDQTLVGPVGFRLD